MYKKEFEHKFEIGEKVEFTLHHAENVRFKGRVKFIHCVLMSHRGPMIEYVVECEGRVYDIPEENMWKDVGNLNFMERVARGWIPREDIFYTAMEEIGKWYNTGDEETRDVHQYLGLTAKEYELLRTDEQEFLKRILPSKN